MLEPNSVLVEEEMSPTSSPEPSVILDLASFLLQAWDISGEISVHSTLNAAVTQAVKSSRRISDDEITAVVQALDRGRPNLCSRLGISAYILVFAVLRVSEECWAKQRGLYLLIEALDDGHVSRKSPGNSTLALENASSISKRARVGQKILGVALKQFCNDNVSDDTRGWMGLLTVELLKDGKRTVQVLVSEPAERRLMIGRIVMNEPHGFLRYIAGLMIREIARHGASWQIFWPGGDETPEERELFGKHIPDSHWLGHFKEYLSRLDLRRETNPSKFVSYPTGVILDHETNYSSVSISSPQIIVSVQGKLSIAVSRCQMQEQRHVVPLHIDVPFESIISLDITENPGGKRGSGASASSFEVDVRLSERSAVSLYVNAKAQGSPFIRLGFAQREDAEELKNIVEAQMQEARRQRPPATPLTKGRSFKRSPDENLLDPEIEDLSAENDLQILTQSVAAGDIAVERTAPSQSINLGDIRLLSSTQPIATVLHAHRVLQDGGLMDLQMLSQGIQQSDAVLPLTSTCKPHLKISVGSPLALGVTETELVQEAAITEQAKSLSRSAHISFTEPINKDEAAEVQDRGRIEDNLTLNSDQRVLEKEAQSDMDNDITSSAGWRDAVKTIEMAPEFQDHGSKPRHSSNSFLSSHFILSHRKGGLTAHIKTCEDAKVAKKSVLVNTEIEATKILDRSKILPAQLAGLADSQKPKLSKMVQRLLDRQGQRPKTGISDHMTFQSPKAQTLSPIVGRDIKSLVAEKGLIIKNIYKSSINNGGKVPNLPKKDTSVLPEEDARVFDIPRSPDSLAQGKSKHSLKSAAKSKIAKASDNSGRLKATPSLLKDGMPLNGKQKKSVANTKKMRRAAENGRTEESKAGNEEQQQQHSGERNVVSGRREGLSRIQAAESSPFQGPSERSTRPVPAVDGGPKIEEHEHVPTPPKQQKSRREAAINANRKIQGFSAQEEVEFDFESPALDFQLPRIQAQEAPTPLPVAYDKTLKDKPVNSDNGLQSHLSQSVDASFLKKKENATTEVSTQPAMEHLLKKALPTMLDAGPSPVDTSPAPRKLESVESKAPGKDDIAKQKSLGIPRSVNPATPPHHRIVTRPLQLPFHAEPSETDSAEILERRNMLAARPVLHNLAYQEHRRGLPQIIEISSGIEPSSEDDDSEILKARRKRNTLEKKRKSEVLVEDSVKRVRISIPPLREVVEGIPKINPVVADDHAHRKANIIGFDTKGPRNQGVDAAKKSITPCDTHDRSNCLYEPSGFSAKRKHREEQESSKQPTNIERKAKTPSGKRRRVINIIASTPEDIRKRSARNRTTKAASISQHTCSQGSRVQENGSPIATEAQVRKVTAIDAAYLFPRSEIDDEDKPSIIDITGEQKKDSAENNGPQECSLGEPNLPTHISQRVGKPRILNGKRSSGNIKQLPSSPTAPSRMLEDMTAHQVAGDGNFVNVDTATIVRATMPQDPFTEGKSGLPNHFLSLLRAATQKDVGKLPLFVSKSDTGPKKQDVNHAIKADPKIILAEIRDPNHGRRPWSSSGGSSSSPSSASMFPSSPPGLDKMEKNGALAQAWIEALRPYQNGVLASLSDLSIKLVRSLVNKEAAIDDAAKDYQFGGNRILDGLSKMQGEDLRGHQSKVKTAKNIFVAIFQGVKDKLDQKAIEVKCERVADIEKRWAMEQQRIEDHLRTAMELFDL